MTRPSPVVDFPQPIRTGDTELTAALDRIRETLGKVSSLVILPLLLAPEGVSVVSSLGGDLIVGSETAMDIDDARLDTFRLVVHGSTSGGDASVLVRDVTPNAPVVELARISLPVGSPARAIGVWRVPTLRPSGARWLEAVVTGNGAATQTLVRVELHARTTRVA